MKTGYAKVLGILLIIVCFFLGVGFLLFSKPIPRKSKLADCTNSVVALNFICPQGDGFQFVLGIAGVEALDTLSQPDYHGTLQILENEKKVYSHEFSSAVNNQLFWLNKDQKVAGYVLTLPRKTAQMPLENILKPGTAYQVTAVFTTAPPPGASVWLYWLQKANRNQ